MAKIKKGDKVIVIAGRSKGKTGEVLKVIPSENRVVVQGANMIKRHQRPDRNNMSGGIIEKEASIHISNVALADPKTGNPTRVGYKILENGEKTRVAKKSGETL